MAGLAGKGMRFTFAGTNFRITRGGLSFRSQLVESTNSESSGHGEYVVGVDDCEVDVDVVYTVTSPVTYNVIANGTSGTAVFSPVSGGGGNWTGTLLIETFQITGEVRGLLMAKITGKYTGGTTPTSV
jgi:hypothetical protein